MSEEEIEQVKSCLKFITNEIVRAKVKSELQLRKMIDSCLVYYKNPRTSSYVLDFKNELDDETFYKILDNQITYFNENYEIVENVYTDSEGVTYNTVKKKGV